MAAHPSTPHVGRRRAITLVRWGIFLAVVLLLLLALTPAAQTRPTARGDVDTWYDSIDVVGSWGYTGSSDGEVIRWPRDTGEVRVTPVTSQEIHDIDMATSSVGYVVTSAGPGGKARVYKTVNGGRTWTVKKTATVDLLACVAFRSATLGWVAGRNGVILKTTNGGRTWVKQRSRTTQTIYQLAFPSDKVGYGVGEAGVILKTADGGKTWTRQKSHTSATLYSVDFVGTAVGYACGGETVGVFLRTTNGGRTWAAKGPALPPLVAVDFATRSAGYAVADTGAWPDIEGRIYRIGQMGDLWTDQTGAVDPAPPTYGLTSLKVMTMTEAYAEGESEASLYTSDGSTWQLAHIAGP